MKRSRMERSRMERSRMKRNRMERSRMEGSRMERTRRRVQWNEAIRQAYILYLLLILFIIIETYYRF